MSPPFPIRPAALDDRAALELLIARSARELCRQDYSEAQIEAALGSAWGVDSQLIADRTYFVVEDDGLIVAAGGWSFRATLFGADACSDRAPRELDPEREAAKVRAFFVAPHYARHGIGRQLLARCESAAQARGYRAAELAATLTGERLYRSMGYLAVRRFSHPLPGGLSIEFVNMHKPLV